MEFAAKRFAFGSREWLSAMLEQLTYGTGITIYHARLKSIIPVLNRLYGVEPPLAFSSHLQSSIPPVPAKYEDLLTTIGAQKALLDLGYDLRIAGAGGIIGTKTREAIKAFRHIAGLLLTESLGLRQEMLWRSDCVLLVVNPIRCHFRIQQSTA